MGLYDFYLKYICLNLKDYPAVGIDLEINKLLLIVMTAIIIGTVIINRKRALITLTVSKLLRREAIGEENSVALKHLGIDTKAVIRLLLGGGQIKTLVKIVGEVTPTYEEYVAKMKDKGYKGETVDLDSAELYLDREQLDTAKRIAQNRSSSPVNTLLFCVLVFAVFVCLILLMPEILTLLNNLFSK